MSARIELSETWRTGLEETVSQLKRHGLGIQILSGDPNAAEALRALTHADPGVCVLGGLTPEQKREHVARLQQQGEIVVFAGDGINDAAALSAADAAIALRSGTDLARASAQAVLMGDDLRSIPQAVSVSRRVRSSIRSNLLFAGTYNLIGMLLAAGGVLHPVAAALLMLGSSFFVSVRALRATAWKDAVPAGLPSTNS